MNKRQLVRKLSMNESDYEDIKKAVQEAESRTTGEIALAAAAESSSYSFWELLCSVLTCSILFICIFPLSGQVYSWLERVLWEAKPVYLTAFYFGVIAVVACILFVVFNIPAIDRFIIPQQAKDHAVYSRAMKYFAESGVYCTKGHSGILIYVSFFERQVRIIADKGISEKISPDMWNLIADEMTENLAKGNAKDAYLCAVKKCGELLAEYFPAGDENPDELNNGLVVLENEPWE